LALTALAISAAVGACGNSSGSPASAVSRPSVGVASTASPIIAPLATVKTTAASPGCPTAATVDSALGTSLSAPVGISGGGGTQLPAGATGVACEYRGTASNVVIELISGISPSSIDLFSSRFPVPYKSVSGVGDQARSFSQPLGAGKDNEGVVATKGTTLVAITATGTPASLKQVEALVSQLL
jgi:hypothetical protein